jgi:hypothetical protein
MTLSALAGPTKMTIGRNERYIDPGTWLAAPPHTEGSLWTAWEEWIREAGSKEQVDLPGLGATEAGYPPLADAPAFTSLGEDDRRRLAGEAASSAARLPTSTDGPAG